MDRDQAPNELRLSGQVPARGSVTQCRQAVRRHSSFTPEEDKSRVDSRAEQIEAEKTSFCKTDIKFALGESSTHF